MKFIVLNVRCYDLDYRLEPYTLELPRAMVTLDLMMAATSTVDKWGLVDLGQLGPAVSQGWFIPSRTEQSSPPLYDHWKVFRDPSSLRLFIPTASQMAFVREKVKRDGDR